MRKLLVFAAIGASRVARQSRVHLHRTPENALGAHVALQTRRVAHHLPVSRRAERLSVELATMESINPAAVKYLNRLSDWFFVAGRVVNNSGKDDVLWVPGANR